MCKFANSHCAVCNVRIISLKICQFQSLLEKSRGITLIVGKSVIFRQRSVNNHLNFKHFLSVRRKDHFLSTSKDFLLGGFFFLVDTNPSPSLVSSVQ